MWGDEDGVIVCFMDKVDFDYELGGALDGNALYPSPEAVFRHEGCGLVEVGVRLRRVIEETDFSESKTYTGEEVRQHQKELKEDPDWIEYQRLRKKFDHRWRHYLELREKQRKESQDE